MFNFLRLKDSKLSTRATWLFAGGLLVIMGGSLCVLSLFFLHSIGQIEQDNISRSNQQARETISLKLNDMATRSMDWAYWDETYQLLTQGDSEFAARNLTAESLRTNDVDLMVFLDRQGQLREAVTLSASGVQIQPLGTRRWQELNASEAIGSQLESMRQRPNVDTKPLSGIIALQGEPYLIAVTPVLNSLYQGPVAGWMIWGRRIRAFFPFQFQRILATDAQLLPVQLSSHPGEPTPTSVGEIEIRTHDDRIQASSPLWDLNHHVVGIIQVTAQRTLHQGAQLSLLVLFVLNLLGSLLLLLLFLRLFRKHVSERFSLLENGIKQLVQANWTTQLQIEGQDEISLASKIINQLVESKQLSRLALDDIEQKFAALYDNATVGILMVHDHHILNLNETALHMLGYEQQNELLGKPFSDLFPPASPQERYSLARFTQMLALGHRMVEWEFVGHSGWRVPCELNLATLAHTADPGWLITIRDITDRRNSESKIKRLSLYDNLTGLLNRYQLQALLQGDLDRRGSDASYFALLYIDIAHFKNINDTFGHSTGDYLLREIAARLSRHLSEQILARVAGDEFVLYLPHIRDFYQPMRLASRIQAWIAEPFQQDESELAVSACLGIVIGSNEFTSAEDVLRCADYALNQSKHHPRQLKLFTSRLYQEALLSTLIKRDLAHAIRNDHLVAYFQPIVDARNGAMVGIEALARWNHPEQGFISPGLFIPIAEEGNLILELGEKILLQACHLGQQLNQNRQAQGLPPLLIHVNLSARHFASPSLLPKLEETLRITQLPASQLAIEITESMLIESPRESIRRMQRIKQLGIHLALDDFGTGYSALNTLCQYPIDVVKLDRSFVLRLMEGKQGELLVRAIINMARDLGLDIIAEGVETQAQQQRLSALGIREIQGFYYYRPMSPDALLALEQNSV
jgi:diguanylate cyclase (GGDEF)-like protein/PAS domain S-box-containing protein